jgi:hypothetical protein
MYFSIYSTLFTVGIQHRVRWSAMLMLIVSGSYQNYQNMGLRVYSWSTVGEECVAGCCYITVDFATAAWQNAVCINHEMCHIMILFHNWLMIKHKSTNNYCFLSYSESYCYYYDGKAWRSKIRFVMQPLQTSPLCSITCCGWEWFCWSVEGGALSFTMYSLYINLPPPKKIEHRQRNLYCSMILPDKQKMAYTN